ncbi:hypothetical protein LguiB_013723 [Lonicera macranthoides]
MHSRLWFHGDVDYVLQNDKGTEAIEGISLVLPMTKETQISSTSFARINNLRLLKMNNVHVTGSLEHLSNQLRWLCWHHYPLKCLQSIFHMDKLVVLDMQYSKLNIIWKGSKNCSSLVRDDMVTFNTVKRHVIHRHSNMVDTEHAGLPGPIRNKKISSALFDSPATAAKQKTCSIFFDIPPTTENKEYVELKFLAVYEAKTDGSVTTRISKVLDSHKASRYQRRFRSSHFKSQNSGTYFLVQLENEIVGGEKIVVCFEIAPSACIVVKMCQIQLFHRTHEGGFSIDKIHGHQIGFDLVETSGGLADKDYDSKSSSIIWEDEDPMINNKRDTEYIYMFHDNINGKFIIGKL